MTKRVFDYVMIKWAEWGANGRNIDCYICRFRALVNTACYWCKQGLNDDEVLTRLYNTFEAI